MQWKLVSSFTGVMLIANSVNDEFIAPNIDKIDGHILFLGFQSVCGAMLLLGVLHRVSGAFLALLMLIFCINFPLAQTIDYIFEFMAISLFLMTYKNKEISLMFLRFGIGLQLIELAIHNKFMNPEIGLGFLQQHPWNFLKLIGLDWFGDFSFVMGAGVAEFLFGLLIALGVATRFTTLCVMFFFVLTSVLLGIHELIGHIPIIAIAITLISLGGGSSQVTTWLSCKQSTSKFQRFNHQTN